MTFVGALLAMAGAVYATFFGGIMLWSAHADGLGGHGFVAFAVILLSAAAALYGVACALLVVGGRRSVVERHQRPSAASTRLRVWRDKFKVLLHFR